MRALNTRQSTLAQLLSKSAAGLYTPLLRPPTVGAEETKKAERSTKLRNAMQLYSET